MILRRVQSYASEMVRAAAGLAAVLMLIGACGGDDSHDAATATSDARRAIDEAVLACAAGDTSSQATSARQLREALALTGANVEGLSDDDVFDLWSSIALDDPDRADRLMGQAVDALYLEAVEHAALAAVLDPRFEELHRGLSNYRADVRAALVPDDDVFDAADEAFEAIRLGCERASALAADR